MKHKILVVDDDPSIVELLVLHLTKAGYDTITAGDGETALKLTDLEKPDLIILDLMIPGIDGFGVCRTLKDMGTNVFTPIMILSARTDPLDKVTCLELCAADYMTKPFDTRELVARVNSLLSRFEEAVSVNPLTKLPGNVIIANETKKRIAMKEKFAFIYFDLCNFKAFNDKYGFERGDDVIKFTAALIKQFTGKTDFVGHVGGDDFIMICAISDAITKVQQIGNTFDSQITGFYSEEDRNNRFIISKDRQGNIKKFPIITISTGIATNEKQETNDFSKLVQTATDLKKYAKTVSITKSNYAVDQRKNGDGSNSLVKKN
jgi:diguanylate cyclase (GGDEF)-like protein